MREAGVYVLGGPWRLTEPCDVTVGRATWLDQAQETAARTNQNAGPHRRKMGEGGGGNRDLDQSVRGAAYRRGNRQLQIHTGRGRGQETAHQQWKCPQRSREVEKMQGEAWDCREERLKQRGSYRSTVRALMRGRVDLIWDLFTAETCRAKNVPRVLEILQSTLDKAPSLFGGSCYELCAQVRLGNTVLKNRRGGNLQEFKNIPKYIYSSIFMYLFLNSLIY